MKKIIRFLFALIAFPFAFWVFSLVFLIAYAYEEDMEFIKKDLNIYIGALTFKSLDNKKSEGINV